jgi:hypothetical protein
MASSRRWTPEGWQVSLVAFLIVAAGVIANYLNDRQDQGEVPDVARGEVTQVLYENCKDDRRFRRAYKIRGEIERRLLQLDRASDEALINFANEITLLDMAIDSIEVPSAAVVSTKLDRVNAQRSRLIERIEILPLPKCGGIDEEADDRAHARKGDEGDLAPAEQSRSSEQSTGGTDATASPGSQPAPGPVDGDAGGPGGGDAGNGGGADSDPPAEAPEPVDPSPPPSEPAPGPGPEKPAGVGGQVGAVIDETVEGANEATGGAVCSLPVRLCP